jgi:Putative peptidoglycan binding domain
MKNFAIVVSAAAVGLLTATSASAKGGGGGSNPPAPAAPAPIHHGASTPAFAPIGGGLPHNFSAPGSYRPLTLSTGGNQTLVYPAVRNSTVRPQGGSNMSAVNSLKQGGGNVPSNAVVVPRGKNKLDPQTVAQLKTGGGNVSTTAQARQNHANNREHHHDRNWWRHHCLALIFFDWGWWGWYDGWWYPAWGYDSYSNYEYNEPIYGAAGLTPDQIIAGVQAKLQQLGYYTYAIDGKMGPLTQSAIARYQSDHHMSITSGIDQPTLTSLGLIH